MAATQRHIELEAAEATTANTQTGTRRSDVGGDSGIT